MAKKVILVRTRVPYFVPNLTVVQAAIKAKKIRTQKREKRLDILSSLFKSKKYSDIYSDICAIIFVESE